jgi:hypothetical protein
MNMQLKNIQECRKSLEANGTFFNITGKSSQFQKTFSLFFDGHNLDIWIYIGWIYLDIAHVQTTHVER